MEAGEMEMILEKIWDLHDKISDAIHSISRTHFLNSTTTNTSSKTEKPSNKDIQNPSRGCVFMKDCRDVNKEEISEAKSLNAIRTALENLEDQLEFYHTVQLQQRAQRDAAIAQLEQSRLNLAMQLANYHGKKYAVIEEALAFVCGANADDNFIAPESLKNNINKQLSSGGPKVPNFLIQAIITSFSHARTSIKLENVAGILGNAALFAVTLLAMVQLHQVTLKSDVNLLDGSRVQEDAYNGRNSGRERKESCKNGQGKHLDVLFGRG